MGLCQLLVLLVDLRLNFFWFFPQLSDIALDLRVLLSQFHGYFEHFLLVDYEFFALLLGLQDQLALRFVHFVLRRDVLFELLLSGQRRLLLGLVLLLAHWDGI